MPDTSRSLSDLQTLLADNVTGAISPQDLRDFLVSALGGYGAMYVKNGVGSQSIGTGFAQINQFTANGIAANITPDHTNDEMTVGVAGQYLAMCFVSFSGTINSTWILNIHVNDLEGDYQCERKLGTGGDVGTAMVCGLLNLSASDTVQLYAKSDNPAQNIAISNAALVLRRVA